MTVSQDSPAAIGVLGGSGLYELEGLTSTREHVIITPFGEPSDAIIGGTFAGREVYFLPRHGRGHRLLPTEINHRANIWALRSLGVRWLLSATAVGSLQEKYRPRDLVIPQQFFDRGSGRALHTFFGKGIVAHVGFAEPTNAALRSLIAQAAQADPDLRVHQGGVYVHMDGPAFSTRAESETHRKLGFDVIGMTNLPEAKLAREAEMAFASMAFITDYDCWKDDEEAVTADTVIGHLLANADRARNLLQRLIPTIPETAGESEHRALDAALITPRDFWPSETLQALQPLLSRYLHEHPEDDDAH